MKPEPEASIGGTATGAARHSREGAEETKERRDSELKDLRRAFNAISPWIRRAMPADALIMRCRNHVFFDYGARSRRSLSPAIDLVLGRISSPAWRGSGRAGRVSQDLIQVQKRRYRLALAEIGGQGDAIVALRAMLPKINRELVQAFPVDPAQLIDDRMNPCPKAAEEARLPPWKETEVQRLGTSAEFLRRMMNAPPLEGLENSAPGLAGALDKADGAIIMTDAAGRITHVNAAFERMSGYSAREVMGAKPGSLLQGPETNPDSIRRMSNALRSRAHFHEEILNFTREGRPYWAEVICNPTFNGAGELNGWIAVQLDVTERRKFQEETESAVKKAELALNTLENYQRALDSHSIVAATDDAGRIIYANRKLCELCGYSEEELLNEDIVILGAECYGKAFFDKIWASLKQGKVWRGEMKGRTKDGKYYWVDATFMSQTSRSGTVTGYVTIQHDITARKNAEAEREEAYRFLDDVSDIAGIGGWEYILATKSKIWSDQAHKIFAVNGRIKPTLAKAFAFYTPESRKTLALAFKAAITKGATWDLEVTATTADGRPIWIRKRCRPVYDRGKLVKLQGTLQDVTERKLAALNTESALEQATEALKAKSAFLANMSHELRTPLNAIIGFSSIMRQQTMGPIDNTHYQRYLEDIETSGRSLLGLIENVLEYSHLSSGKQDTKLSRVNLLETVLPVTLGLMAEATEKNVALVAPECGDYPDALADERGLRKVLRNLIDNAIKFTQPGGSVSVAILVDQRGNPCISIADTGCGIHPSRLIEIGRPFMHSENVYTKHGGGSGLGLAISKALLQNMLGELNVDSTLGRGTRVLLTLKAADQS